jgi:hypothetical protein
MTRRIRKAVFPVAGLGTRFLPATKSIPKDAAPHRAAIFFDPAAGAKQFRGPHLPRVKSPSGRRMHEALAYSASPILPKMFHAKHFGKIG